MEDNRMYDAALRERDLRVRQVINLDAALQDAKRKLAKAKSVIDETEQDRNPDETEKAYKRIREAEAYLKDVQARQGVVSGFKHSATIAFQEVERQGHKCFGCRVFQEHSMFNEPACFYNHEARGAPVPCSKITKCPDPSAKFMDSRIPRVSPQPQPLPGADMGRQGL